MSGLQLQNIRKSFGAKMVLRDVSLEIEESEFMVFVGPSGCGKSTLLRIIAGFDAPDSGDVFLGGRRINDLPPGERAVAMVFQSYALYPHMTVAQNLGFSLANLKVPRRKIEEEVRNVAEALQIESLLDRIPSRLSGGQRQRVAIGRAVIRNPKLFLFDEPLSNLDALLRAQMRVELAKIHQRFKTTTIYVTHDQVEAMTLADRIAVLNGGILEQLGSPLEVYHRPKNIFVAGFIGSPSMNFLPAYLVSTDHKSINARLPNRSILNIEATHESLVPGAQVTIGVRPENLGLFEEGQGTFRVQVNVVERLGGRTLVYATLLDAPGKPPGLTAEFFETAGARASDCKPGQIINFGFVPGSIHLFNAQGDAVITNDTRTEKLYAV